MVRVNLALPVNICQDLHCLSFLVGRHNVLLDPDDVILESAFDELV